MADKIAGYLEIGVNDRHEVVVNVPADLPTPGHIVFSANQARALAASLMAQARNIDGRQPTCVDLGLHMVGGALAAPDGVPFLVRHANVRELAAALVDGEPGATRMAATLLNRLADYLEQID